MSLLVETIQIRDGIPVNLAFHEERMERSLQDIFSVDLHTDLKRSISVPGDAAKGIFKCRIEYDREIRRIEFVPYVIKPVNSLKLVFDDGISYSYKYIKRDEIAKLMERRGECDDILIVKNGMITDTSYANVVLKDKEGRWITPSTFLLPGTRRASLLRSGLIIEGPVRSDDLKNYSHLKLINAMIGIEDTYGIPVSKIIS